jgi:Type II CAAX prenyl endopeptidase Rce1-like
MTEATPSGMRPPSDAHPELGARPTAVPGAPVLVATRIGLFVGVQLVIAGLLIVTGTAAAGEALNTAAGWWMVYIPAIDLGTLGVLLFLIRRQGISYRSILGPPASAWQVGLGALGVLAATVPAVALGAEINNAFYGDATLPMFAIVDVPEWAGVIAVVVAPVLAELAEPVAYLGVLLPWLERRTGRSWLAATIVVVIWAAEHAFYPLLVNDGSLDLAFAGYRVVSVMPFLAVWTALYFAFGRRLLPIMFARWIFNAGSALAVILGLAG